MGKGGEQRANVIKGAAKISMAEVKKHNIPSDAWMTYKVNSSFWERVLLILLLLGACV